MVKIQQEKSGPKADWPYIICDGVKRYPLRGTRFEIGSEHPAHHFTGTPLVGVGKAEDSPKGKYLEIWISEDVKNPERFKEQAKAYLDCEVRYYRRTDEELKEIAKGIFDGSIFTSDMMRRIEDLPHVFMPVGLMEDDYRKNLAEAKPHLFYEKMHRRAPLGVNGMPMFFSFSWLNKEDTERMYEFYKKIKDAYDNL